MTAGPRTPAACLPDDSTLPGTHVPVKAGDVDSLTWIETKLKEVGVTALLTEVDAWKTALVVGIAMLTAWYPAWRRGQALDKVEGREPTTNVSDATVALLGLLLAFTFSMALVKHEQRRQMVVTDSNAIGDFYTCVSLVAEPVRGKLQAVVRKYVEHRLSLAHDGMDETTLQRHLDYIRTSHGQMQALVQKAVDAGTPVTIPLVNTLNAVTSSHASRLAAVRDRLPASIVLLLFVSAVASMALIGRQHGAVNEWRPGAAVVYAAIVSMSIWITLDLNQPHRGWITVSEEPLEQLLKGMQDQAADRGVAEARLARAAR